MPSLCPACSVLNIKTILRDGLSKENMIPLGFLVDILHRADQCRFCHLVASLFRHSWCLDILHNVDLSGIECSIYSPIISPLNRDIKEKKQCHRLRLCHSGRPTEINNVLRLTDKDLTLDIQLLEEDAHKFRRARNVHGRRMTDMVDMGLVKAWISLCERKHGDACESIWWRGREIQLPPFVRMLDITLMSVVRAPSDCRYVALSYIWGSPGDTYWTTTANMDARAQPAGLDPSFLPGTIMDAIHVTRALGERYLWIDSLCILQDSSNDKDDQIHVMELIYSCAMLTIVAAGGENVHSRLPGVSAGSRHLHQHIEVIEGLHLAIPLPSLREAITQSVWATRGWTFQELLLSRRRLIFTRYQVYFECGRDIWCEDLVAESKVGQYSDNPMCYAGSGAGLFSSPRPPSDLFMDSNYTIVYTNLVEGYTSRHLTFPSDILHAITALTNAMTKMCRLARGDTTQAFRYGMPIWYLDHSLLWQPRLDSVQARRASTDSDICAWPSWSWTGWTGAMSYSDLAQFTTTAILTTHLGKPGESLVTLWYIVDDNRQLIRLEVERISFIRIEDPTPERVSRQRYQHPEGDTDKLEPLPPVGTLIFCTQSATFRVSQLEDSSNGSKRFPHTIFHILSDVRQPSVGVGRIILPFAIPPSATLELIVLSRAGGYTSGLYDESVYGRHYDGCFLNVMAVKGVGYDVRVQERVGLGIIFEQAWLECSPEVRTVLLR